MLRLGTRLMVTRTMDASMAPPSRDASSVYLLLTGTVATVLGVAVTAYMFRYV